MDMMKAVAFRGKNRIAVDERPKPVAGPGQAVIRITTTTICGTDVHIVKGEYPVRDGLILGHEPVGYINRRHESRAAPEHHASGPPADARPLRR